MAVVGLVASGVAPGQNGDLVLSSATARVSADVGTQGNVKYGNLVDPGDEFAWSLTEVPLGVYRAFVEVRTGSRGEGLDFIPSYRLVAPDSAFPKGADPHEIAFEHDPAEQLSIAGRGEGYIVMRGYVRAKCLLRLTPGDEVRLHSTGHHAHVWGIRLRPVPEAGLQELSASMAPLAHLFAKGESVALNVTVTNWHDTQESLPVSCRVTHLDGTTLWESRREVSVPAMAAATTTMQPRDLRRGPLTAHVALHNGKTELAHCRLDFAVSPALRPKDMPEDSLFAIHKGDVSEWPTIGAKWNRLWDTGDTWNRIEREKGQFDWTVLDKKVADAERHGVKLLYVFAYTPTWASSRPGEPHYTGGGARAPAKDIEDWKDFVRAVVTRYRGRMDHFEVWNEPNAGFFTGTPKDYVRLLKAAYETAKQANPDCTIVGISGTGGYLQWMEEVFKLGGLNYMDVVSVHTYTTPNSPEHANVLGRYQATWALIDKYKPAGRVYELWNTETGVWVPERDQGRPLTADEINAKAPKETAPNWKASWPYRPVDEMTAARHVVSHYLLAAASNVKHLFWYAWYTQVNPMYTVDNAPRYHTVALAGLASVMNGARYVKRLDLGAADLHLHAFARGDEAIGAFWNVGRETRRVSLTTKAPRVIVTDLWGNEREVQPTDETLSLDVGADHTYVRGPTLAEFESIRLDEAVIVLEAVDAEVSHDAAPAGNIKEHTSKPHHGDRRVMGLPDAGDQLRWQLKGVPPGVYEVLLEARTGTHAPGANYVASWRLTHVPAQGAPRPLALALDGDPELTRKGENYSNYYGRMLAAERIRLTEGDAFTVEFGTAWGFVSKLMLRKVAETDTTRPLPCPKSPMTLALPFTEAMAARAPRLDLNARRQAAIGVADPFASTSEADAWKGTDDSSAVTRVLWDDTHLGLLVTVTDDKLVPPSEGQGTYNGDAIEVFLDFRQSDQLGAPMLGEGVLQLMLGLPAQPNDRPRQQGPWPEGSRVSVTTSDTGYTMALLLPWDALTDQPIRPGLTFGFDLALDDADQARDGRSVRKAQLVWHGTANNFQDPSAYGRLRLGE